MPVSSHTHHEEDGGRQPPHGLQLVIDFVNTRDIDLGLEELDSPAALAAWLSGRGLGAVSRADRRGLACAHEVREALRVVLLAHNGVGDAPAAPAAAALERAAERGRLSVVFREDGSVATEPRAAGVDGALAALLVPVAEAAADGTWERVKACPAGDCHWAFYDHSRNRSARWCDMAVCGNRTKVRAYRSKRSD